jgi:hypothetical protein
VGHWNPILGPSPETSGVSRYTGPVQMKGLCRYLTSAIRVPLPLIRPLVDPLPVYTSPQALLIPCRELPDLLCLILYRCVPSLKTLPIQETHYSYLKQVHRRRSVCIGCASQPQSAWLMLSRCGWRIEVCRHTVYASSTFPKRKGLRFVFWDHGRTYAAR